MIESLPLNAQINEIVITADIDGVETVALVASADGTVSVLEIQNRVSANLLAQIDVGSRATDIGLDGSLALAAVATGSNIQILDVSDPASPQLVTTISESVSLVEVENGRLFAADDGQILMYDLVTGARLQDFDLTSSASSVRAMSMEGGRLYVIDGANQLSVLEVQNDALFEIGKLSLAGQSWANNVRTDKIFVSDSVLYIPTDQGFNAGFATVDIADPAAMSVLSGPDDRAISGTDFADAGNGVGLAVGRLGGVFGTDSVMVVDISDPTATDGFVTRFDLDAAPTVVNASAGFAYVGDADGNFHIINALGFDTQGVAPTIVFDPSAADADTKTAGLQLEEGRFINLPVTVTDDKQIQKVELLLDGEVIRTDLSVPYSLQVQVPTLASGTTTGTLQVRATDTGGNVSVSSAVAFDIIPDNTAPDLIRVFPPDQGLALPDRVSVRTVFRAPRKMSRFSRILVESPM